MAKRRVRLHAERPARLIVAAPTKGDSIGRVFSEVAQRTSREVGRAWVFGLAIAFIVIWAVTGPIFNFSDTWQLVINTGTTIVTFLMVFLIQNAQNRDAAAIQVKLDELIRVSHAHNSFIGVEALSDEELEDIRSKYAARTKLELAKQSGSTKTRVNGNDLQNAS
jgi:low affinity Fe/Cu permease